VLGGGIDMSAANRNLQITSFRQQADHTWNVATGGTLTIGTSSTGAGRFSQANSSALSLVVNGGLNMVGDQMWQIDYAYVYDTENPGSTIRPLNFQGSHQPGTSTQTFVAITAVPEPTTLALLAAASLGLTVVAARRRFPNTGKW